MKNIFLILAVMLAGCSDEPLSVDDAKPNPIENQKANPNVKEDAPALGEFKPKPLTIDRDTPVSIEKAAGFVSGFWPWWKHHHVDEVPSVKVGDRRAYRISYASQFRRPSAVTQGQLYVDPDPSDYEDDIWEFVLIVDDGKEIAADEKNTIQWSEVWRPGERQPIELGRGYGFIWITNATIKEQHKIRPLLNLAGGEDELDLVTSGMLSTDQFMRQDCALLMRTFGDKALPRLEKLLSMKAPLTDGRPDRDWHMLIVEAISGIRTPAGTSMLIKLYRSDNKRHHQWIHNGLTSRPFRPEAKDVYLEMLDQKTKNRGSINGGNDCGRACVEFGLIEAIPMFERVLTDAWAFHVYTDAYFSIQKLSGKSFGDDFNKAMNLVYQPSAGREKGVLRKADLEWASKAFATEPDVQGSILRLIDMYKFRPGFKGDLPAAELMELEERQRFSVDTLKSIPGDVGLAEVERLSKLWPKDEHLKKLAGRLSK